MSILDPALRDKLRGPFAVWAALMGLLGAQSAIGVLSPHGHWWILEVLIMFTMVALVIVISMEMFHHRPIVRLFSVLGFFWVAILFGMTMIDYVTR